MKLILTFLLIIIVLTHCEKDVSTAKPNIYTLTTVDGWLTINFKTNYTIQVPNDFLGIGMAGFEGNTFEKYSKDSKIILSYAYSNGGTFFYDFGDNLQHPIPKNLTVKDQSGISHTLDKTDFYTQNSDTLGIFYYSNDTLAFGKVYWLDNGFFKQALDIKFYSSECLIVQLIISTIKRK